MPEITHMQFEALGTQWQIDFETSTRNDTEQAIMSRIEEFDSIYSRFRSDSLVHVIAQNAGAYTFPDDAEALFTFYRQLYSATNSLVTPLIGSLMEAAGYDAQYSLIPSKILHATPDWEAVMQYDHPALTTHIPVTLDFGAAGKGYLVDIIGALLQDQGISNYTIDAGGDMLRKSSNDLPLQVGLENPFDTTQAIGIVELTDGSICGSASNRRAWAGLHHIMDPHSAEPVHDIVATWVTARSAMQADGLATGLFFTDPSKLQEQFVFEYCIVYSDGSFKVSTSFPGKMFS